MSILLDSEKVVITKESLQRIEEVSNEHPNAYVVVNNKIGSIKYMVRDGFAFKDASGKVSFHALGDVIDLLFYDDVYDGENFERVSYSVGDV